MPQDSLQNHAHAVVEATTSGSFTCPICLEERPKADLFTPSGCSHRLCKPCAREVVLNAARSLDFPIDCPVCRLDKPEEEDQVQQLQQSAQQVQGSASQHSSTLTAANRSLSDNISAQLGKSQQVTEYILYGSAEVDPDHATQLHAVASTPSLGSTGHDADNGGNHHSPYDEEGDMPNGLQFPPQHFPPSGALPNGLLPQPHAATAHRNVDSLDSPRSTTASPAYVSARPEDVPAVQFGLSKPVKGMPRVPSFPIIASGTPITPILVPANGQFKASRAIFSPHLPSTASEPKLAIDPTFVAARASAPTNVAQSSSSYPATALQPPLVYPAAEAGVAARVVREESDAAEVGMRSLSLGRLTNQPAVVARGLSSPADWSAADYSRSSSLGSGVSSGVSRGDSNAQQMRPLRSQRGSLDADVHILLNEAELNEYLSKSLKAAAHRYGSLVQCPKPDCDGVASLPQMEPHFQCPKCSYEWCRWCHGNWHEGIREWYVSCMIPGAQKSQAFDNVTIAWNSNDRCKKEPEYFEPQASGSRYIPEQAKPIQPTHSRYIPKRRKESRHKGLKSKRGLSIGSMGDLIARSMKGTMESMKRMGSGDLADAGTSLNKYLKRNRVLECPTCKNGITKVEGGCNHIMCAVCKTHICWLCGAKICQGVNNYWDANRHFWIKGTKCYGQIQTVTK